MAASTLKSINRTDETAFLQLFFHFDKLPAHSTTTTGRKVDLILEKTTVEATAEPPEMDNRLVKMTSRKEPNGNTHLSFYFRYPPQKVTLRESKSTALLMMDVLLGNPITTSHPELATQLQGVTVLHRAQADSLHPKNASRYATNWNKLFSEYESEVLITPSPRLTLPPFPLAAALRPAIPSDQWLPAEVLEAASGDKWNQVSQTTRQLLSGSLEESLKERLVLTYAEALVRAGEYQEPHELLQRIALQYPETLMADLADFLFIYLQAGRSDPFAASYDLERLAPKLAGTPFRRQIDMLQAKLALVGGRIDSAEKIIAEGTARQDETLSSMHSLLQADILWAKKEPDKALALYEQEAGKSATIDTEPMSLANYAALLYAAKRYEEAARKYQALADVLANEELKGLALFQLAMCQLRRPATAKSGRIDLMQIQDVFAGSEGGMRARMKLIDLDYLEARVKPEAALAVYSELAEAGKTVTLREEAWFKKAVVLAQTKQHIESVHTLGDMLRVFQSGPLRVEAQALLIEQLPTVLKQMVDANEHVKALVLAKQNRTLFAKGWLAPNLLFDLARAYSNLGLMAQAAETYQYLFEVATEGEQEGVYLPLIQTLFASGQYVQAEQYADRYALRYPHGSDSQSVYYFKVRSLFASGQLEKTLELLRSEDAPRSPQLELLKARIFFEQQQWPQVIEVLEQPELQASLDQEELILLLAESYFQSNQDDKAKPLFARLADLKEKSEQARFRLAQLELRKNNRPLALKLLQELAEKGTDSLWTKLAREEAALLQLQTK